MDASDFTSKTGAAPGDESGHRWYPGLSVAAKKGTSSAVETEPGTGLRSGLRWAQEMGKERLLASLRPDCPRF
jgi:hypothetical protein